jgi:uncharacterized protein (DUF2235 family)
MNVAKRLSIGVILMVMASGSSVAAESSSSLHPPKRLVLCLDGTWNSGYEQHQRRDGHTVLKPTNPLKLCRAVRPFDASSGRMQIVYYDLGVGALAEYPGTSNHLLRVSDRTLGGAWGAGFEGNVEDALNFLVLNFESGDDVFVFGFSRGAAEARAVTEFLQWNHGLPEKEDAYYVPQLFRAYVTAHGAAWAQPKELETINTERQALKRDPIKPMRPVTVKYLGVWDTVMALGSRFQSVHDSTSTAGRSFYAGAVPATCVEHARQALAVDERRYDFRPEIWTGHEAGQTMEQRWFAGVHSNVGGSYGNDGLANIPFHWILKGATDLGLIIDEEFVKHYKPFAGDTIYESYTKFYRILDHVRSRTGAGKRNIRNVPKEANADLDRSVIDKMQMAKLQPSEDGTPAQAYRPENVIEFLAGKDDLDAYLKNLGITKPLPEDVVQRIAELRQNDRRSGTPQ